MITLHLQRIPFHPVKRTIFVPINQILVLHSPIVMSVLSSADEPHTSSLAAVSSLAFQSDSSASLSHPTLNHNHHEHKNHKSVSTGHEDDLTTQPLLYKELLQYTHQSNLWTHRHDKQSLSLHPTNNNQKANYSHASSLHCWSHNYNQLKVRVVRKNSMSSKQVHALPTTSVLLESGGLQESISLPASKLNLIYRSEARYIFINLFLYFT